MLVDTQTSSNFGFSSTERSAHPFLTWVAAHPLHLIETRPIRSAGQSSRSYLSRHPDGRRPSRAKNAT